MKRYLAIILAALLLLSLAACKTSEPPAPVAEPTGEAAESTPEPTADPTETPTETPTEPPVETPDPDVFVPAGYDAHDYLVLAEFFSTPTRYSKMLGEDCYEGFDVEDPATWHDNFHGVKWDPVTGKCTAITLYPSDLRIPASLDLTGFEKLNDVEFWYTTLDRLTIADCPALTDGCMIYSGNSLDEARIEAGYVAKLNAESYSGVYCSLMGDKYPFTLALKSEGQGRVKASAAYYEGEYRVSCIATADEYIDFLGWYDDGGELVSTDRFLYLAGGDLGYINGDYSYTARFSQPEAPTPIPEGDFFCELKPNVPSKIDIDGDGEEDTVLVSVKEYDEEEENDDLISVTVTLAAEPDDPYYFPAGDEGGCICAAVVDFDLEDGHKEIVLSYDMCDGDPVTYVWRMKDDGSGFDEFVEYIEVAVENDDWFGTWYYHGLPEDYVFTAEHGLDFVRRTEILGTTFVANRFTVTEDGIEIIDAEYRYMGSEPLKLKKDLKVTLENGKTKTVKKGSEITAYSTDRETFVKVMLEDGSIGTVEVTFGNSEYKFPVLLNGVDQDEYAEIGYAD
ncbi:MAG: hypothetical protein IKG85_01495 [Clostridia bacterium]|nr:hypothetical protein [Clostridia bacterium]